MAKALKLTVTLEAVTSVVRGGTELLTRFCGGGHYGTK